MEEPRPQVSRWSARIVIYRQCRANLTIEWREPYEALLRLGRGTVPAMRYMMR